MEDVGEKMVEDESGRKDVDKEIGKCEDFSNDQTPASLLPKAGQQCGIRDFQRHAAF